jgi:FG-GAP repeat
MEEQIMRGRTWIASTAIALLLGPALLGSGLPAPAANSPLPILQGTLAVDHLKEQGLYGSLQEAVAAARYGVYKVSTDSGEWLADNPAQQLRARFTTAGLQLDAPGDGRAHRFAMSLRSAGYGNRQIAARAGPVTASGGRAEIRHELQLGALSRTGPRIIEWYHNRAEGLEQGFTLESAPGERRDGERLRVALALDGELGVEAVDDGQALEFKDEAGDTVLRYDHLVVTDGEGRRLQATMAVSEREGAGEVWLEVDDRGAAWPVTIDPTFTHQQSLGPSGAAADYQFGLSVAISGDTVVVGAQDYYWQACQLQDPNCLPLGLGYYRPDRGSAYVFVRSNGAWTQQQKLMASDGTPDDGFGASVAIRGDRIVVGASRMNAYQGSAYVFSRRGSSWREQQKLTAKNGAYSDLFGMSVAIGDDTIVVGAPGTDDGQVFDTGSAYVFENSGGSWIPQELVNTPRGAGDGFGWSVAVSGSTIVVGAPDNGPPLGHGTATIFARTNGVWSWQQALVANDGATGDWFGAAVAISGAMVVVGAPKDDDFGVVDQGSAYVFGGKGGVWWQQQKLINLYPGDFDSFGSSVATNGKMVAVGVPSDELFGTPDQGTALVYEWSGGAWRVHQWFLFMTGTVLRAFGTSVAISEGTVVVGAPGAFFFGGSAHVFDQNTRPTIWAEVVQRPSAFQVIRAAIATVADAQDIHSALTVTVNGAASALVNGVTISAIGVDSHGTVTADIATFNGASDASFTLRVTDTGGLFAEATLVVRDLTINP